MIVLKKIKYWCAFVLLTGIIKLYAQDIHFSQFYNASTSLNPAATGDFSGNYRFSSNYKNQWQSISNPYKTIFASFELLLPVKRVALGVSFFNDKAGKSQVGTTQGNISSAYILRIDSRNSLSAGLQAGFAQKSIRLDGLKWDSQYNGTVYDPSLSSGEATFNDAFFFIDASAGILYNYYDSKSQLKTTAGLSILHANQPRQSFYNSGNEKLNSKIAAYYNGQIKILETQAYILPQLLYTKQGSLTEVTVGGMIKYVIGMDNASLLVNIDHFTSSAAFLGLQYRVKDALILNAAFELKKTLLLGFSYDLNTSKLRIASTYKGGMEIAIIYKGSFR